MVWLYRNAANAMNSPQPKVAGAGARVVLQPGAAVVHCRAAKAALWRLTRISVESLLMPEPPQEPKNQPGLDELITLSEAAEISGFTTRHLRLLAENGQLWAKKLGRNWFTTAHAVHEYLAVEHRPGPKPTKRS
jgi:hypothetical protein